MGHPNKHLRLVAFALAGVCLLAGCSKEQDIKTRHFRMGFVPDDSNAEVQYPAARLADEAEIVNHRLDTGVPWQESLQGSAFDPNILADWNFRKSKGTVGQQVYVSVSPLNIGRNGLALYRGAQENMSLPSPWNGYAFNSGPVKEAYLNYCRRVIDFFHPDYFAMSTETNLLYLVRPQTWTAYLELQQYVYGGLKTLYPDLPVFSSVSGAPMLNGFVKDNDYVQQRLAAMQVLEFSDYFALSIYPSVELPEGKPYPRNVFDELFSLSEKPVVVAETGYAAGTRAMSDGRNFPMLIADAVNQQKFMNELLEASEKWKAKFVICFPMGDKNQLRPDDSYDSQVALQNSGLRDEVRNLRPALNPWNDWLRRKVVQ